ncbi:DUF3892 domain-containing protein [Aeromicrobium alkaliterrae]|uniref:DUF3892 domain-containing protein n=1 Tax=Aeromicrobium alkaliterrae TaxID=302168 RepID=A0ABN2JG32_9ACTN
MSDHRIVCCEQTGCSTSGHIVAVGIGSDPKKAKKRMTVREVWTAMDDGDRFYTADADGNTAWVKKLWCGCGKGSLKSEPDRTTANNLDNLRLCSWSAS